MTEQQNAAFYPRPINRRWKELTAQARAEDAAMPNMNEMEETKPEQTTKQRPDAATVERDAVFQRERQAALDVYVPGQGGSPVKHAETNAEFERRTAKLPSEL
jgi:hypothetical protein